MASFSRVPSPAVRTAASNRSCGTSVGRSPQIALTAWPSAAISLSEVIDYLLRNRLSFEKKGAQDRSLPGAKQRAFSASRILFVNGPGSLVAIPPRRMRNGSHHLSRRPVLPLPPIRDRPQQVALRPCQVGHLHDHLGPHPMHAGKLKG